MLAAVLTPSTRDFGSFAIPTEAAFRMLTRRAAQQDRTRPRRDVLAANETSTAPGA